MVICNMFTNKPINILDMTTVTHCLVHHKSYQDRPRKQVFYFAYTFANSHYNKPVFVMLVK